MARIMIVAALLACIAVTVMAGPCQFVDGDCKPRASALTGAPTGAATNWVALLKGFESCKGRTGAACSGVCVNMPGKGCTLTPAARKAFLGTKAAEFAACTKLSGAACTGNTNCKAGTAGTCVIGLNGVINTFGLTTSFPTAVPVLRKCKMYVADAKACDA